MLKALSNRRTKADDGFTLIELLIVIVILGILAAIVVFSVKGITDKGTKSACKADVETVTVAEEAFYAGSYGGTPLVQNGATTAGYGTLQNLVDAGLMHSLPSTSKYTVSVNTTTGAVTSNKDTATEVCGSL